MRNGELNSVVGRRRGKRRKSDTMEIPEGSKRCECSPSCTSVFKINTRRPKQIYAYGHSPTGQKILCGCGCGTIIDSIKNGKPRRFVNHHESKMRSEKIKQEFKEYRADPVNAANIADKLSKAWLHRPRSEINIGVLKMKCNLGCGYEWLHLSKTRRNVATCPNCRKSVSKIGVKLFEVDTSNPFLFCADGCGLPLLPAKNGRKNKYVQGHGPHGIVECGCGCGGKIKNPDSSGRFRYYILGHNPMCSHSPTKPELKISQIILKYSLPFDFVGDGSTKEKFLRKYMPDFVSTNRSLKQIIEVQGVYWHDEEDEREIRRHTNLTAAGYSILYIWEDEIFANINKATKSKRKLLTDDEICMKIKNFFPEVK